MEAAALLNRITRSSVIRTVQIEVGDMPKSQVQNTLRRVKDLMEQKTALGVGSGMVEYTNPGAFENNIYLATHNGQGAVTMGTIGGDVDVKNLADLDYWNNKFYSSYGIPKQYFGWCLSPDTRIPLLNGEVVEIGKMYEEKDSYIGKGILGVDKEGNLISTVISNITLTNPHAKKLLKITLDNENSIEVTPEHRMMLRDGSFIEAKDVKVNDNLMPYYEALAKDGHAINEGDACMVVGVENIDTDEPVYDLTVADECHTFPVAAGVFVHNCDDGAGFNGGSSLTILSSVYAKGVKRVQNALIQAITDAVNLILVNKGLRAYVNNFTVKMKTPSTQEEKDYRDELSNKINAISNMQSLFANVEDKARQLEILKTLLSGLNYGDDLTAILDREIDAINAQRAKEEAEAAAVAEAGAGANEGPLAGPRDEGPRVDNEIGLDNFDLNPPPGANEGFRGEGGEILTEDGAFDNDLPMPEELNAHKDFSKNE